MHLRVFGCGAYVHIPKDMRTNSLSPKSELMVYLGHIEGIKAYTFMRMSNNTLFTSATALFDEELYPKCQTAKPCGVTRLKQPTESQPDKGDEDPILDGDDFSPSPPETTKNKKEAECPDTVNKPEAPGESSIKFPSVEPQ